MVARSENGDIDGHVCTLRHTSTFARAHLLQLSPLDTWRPTEELQYLLTGLHSVNCSFRVETERA